MAILNQVVANGSPFEITFSAAGNSAAFSISGNTPMLINFSNGTGVGSVALQRSTDGGVNFTSVTLFSGTPNLFPSTGGDIDTDVIVASAPDIYRFRCSPYTSGSIYCRMGRKPNV